jgi:hypothetical protein
MQNYHHQEEEEEEEEEDFMHLAGRLVMKIVRSPWRETDRLAGWLGRQNLKNKGGTLHMVFCVT